MSQKFDALRVTLFGLLSFSLNISEGQGLRGVIARLWGIRAGGGKKKKKRRSDGPTRWCYADDGLCVAQVASGAVHLFVLANASAGGGGGGGGGGGTRARGGSPRMQLSDDEVEANLATMRGSSGKPERQPEGGVVLGAEALEVGVVLVPLLALALFSIEEYVRARL